MSTIAENPTWLSGAPLVVTFRVGRQSYGLPLDAVLQVVRLPALTVVPGAPPQLAGLLNLRGSFVPVLDGRALLGEPPEVSLQSQVLVLGAAAAPTLSLLVDAVAAVRRFPPGSFTALASPNGLVAGMLHERGEPVVVLDPEALAAAARA